MLTPLWFIPKQCFWRQVNSSCLRVPTSHTNYWLAGTSGVSSPGMGCRSGAPSVLSAGVSRLVHTQSSLPSLRTLPCAYLQAHARGRSRHDLPPLGPDRWEGAISFSAKEASLPVDHIPSLSQALLRLKQEPEPCDWGQIFISETSRSW